MNPPSTESRPPVSVVILNWNGLSHLREFLPSVVRHTPSSLAGIVVADNGSEDGSAAFVEREFPSVRLLRLDRNYGFTGGYNRALSRIDAAYYVLLNSDVEVTPGWLEPLVAAVESSPSVAAVMPKMLSFADRSRFEYAGACGGFIDVLGYPFCRGRLLSVTEEDKGQYDTQREVFWASGACLLVRADLYHTQGGLDEDFFAHMEEIDLCWRLKNAGHRILAEPASTVYHLGGGTLPNESPRKLYLNFRNNLRMLYKNLPSEKLVPVLAVRMVLDGLAAVSYLLRGRGKGFAAVLRAHLDFYRGLPALRVKRRQQRQADGLTGIYPGSVLWRFFTGTRTFARLKW